MLTLEKDIERRLTAAVKARGGLCLKWVCPGWAGVPDRLVLLPGGRIIFVELKRPAGELAKRQAWWATKLRTLGFICTALWSAEDVEKFIKIEFGGTK